jgi:hypothetical protein
LPHYGSLGASCNIEVELDQSIFFQNPVEWQEKIRQVFAACRQAVQEELRCETNSEAPSVTNGRAGKPPEGRPATRNQIRAIESIVRERALDLTAVLRAYGVEGLSGLTLQEASRLIDSLRSAAGVDC